MQPAELLSALQAQAIGPVEEDSSWTIAGKDEPQTPTVIANDGADGQIPPLPHAGLRHMHRAVD